MRRADAACVVIRWQHFSAWNDVIAAILKLWHHIRNPTPSIDEKHSCQISSRSDLKRRNGAYRLFWRWSPNKKNKNNKRSSNMGPVPDPTKCQYTSKSLSTLSQKSATICRRKQRLSQRSATVAEFRRCLEVFGDSRTFLRQSHFSATVWTWLNQNASDLRDVLITIKTRTEKAWGYQIVKVKRGRSLGPQLRHAHQDMWKKY